MLRLEKLLPFRDLVLALSAAAMALGHRQWFIQSACATTGDGLYEARLGFGHDFVTTFRAICSANLKLLLLLPQDTWFDTGIGLALPYIVLQALRQVPGPGEMEGFEP